MAGERRYAVLVGVNEGDPEEIPLRFAESDADRVARVLGDLGEVPDQNLVLLRRADRTRLLDALDGLGRHIEADMESGQTALLIVYYSGHADATSLHLGGTRLSFDDLTAALEAMPVDSRVLIVDACRSGGLTRVKGAAPAEPFAISAEDRLAATGTAIITSSAAGEDAQESDLLEGGVFTHHLVAGLLGAADDPVDGVVTLTEAYSYVYGQTLRATSAERVVQHPTFAFDLRGREDLVLTRVEASARRGSLVLDQPGDYLVFEASRGGRLVTEVAVPAGGSVALSPGSYLVRQRRDDSVRESEVTIGADESVVVAGSDMTVMPYGRTARKGMAARSRSAVGLTLAGGVVGPSLAELGTAPSGAVGVRADLTGASVQGRVRAARYATGAGGLSVSHQETGADLSILKLFDVGRFAPGLGLRGGGDGVFQRFETEGKAPPRKAFVGRFGPLLRLEVAPGARIAFGIDLGAEARFQRVEQAVGVGLVTTLVPYALVEVIAYPF